MRLLFFSNSPAEPTGYGTQMKYIQRYLPPLGYEVAFAANVGVGTMRMVGKGMSIYPAGRRTKAGDDLVWAAVEDFKPDLVISLYDPWALTFPKDIEVPWVSWAIVDSLPLDFLAVRRLLEADGIVACSRWGERSLKRAGFEPAYIPLGIPTDFYVPGDRSAARAGLHDIPDDVFLVTMVGRNNTVPARKGFVQAIEAFAPFHAQHPNTALYLHTGDDEWEGGISIRSLVEEVGGGGIYWADQAQYKLGLPEGVMLQIYQTSDVLLFPSDREGFGLPIVEAQACGVPVIATNWGPMTELVKEAGGWLLPSSRDWGPHRSWTRRPGVKPIYQALTSAYRSWQNEEEWNYRREAARRGALPYDFNNVAGGWDEYLRSRKWQN